MSLPKTTQDAEKLAKTNSDSTLADETPFFLLSVHETATKLKTDPENGLHSDAVAALQARDGPNQLSGGGGVSPWGILAAQIFNAMILVLIICLAVSLGIQSWIEGGVIGAVILINVVSR
jgi:P-type Na+/K+ transporter